MKQELALTGYKAFYEGGTFNLVLEFINEDNNAAIRKRILKCLEAIAKKYACTFAGMRQEQDKGKDTTRYILKVTGEDSNLEKMRQSIIKGRDGLRVTDSVLEMGIATPENVEPYRMYEEQAQRRLEQASDSQRRARPADEDPSLPPYLGINEPPEELVDLTDPEKADIRGRIKRAAKKARRVGKKAVKKAYKAGKSAAKKHGKSALKRGIQHGLYSLVTSSAEKRVNK